MSIRDVRQRWKVFSADEQRKESRSNLESGLGTITATRAKSSFHWSRDSAKYLKINAARTTSQNWTNRDRGQPSRPCLDVPMDSQVLRPMMWLQVRYCAVRATKRQSICRTEKHNAHAHRCKQRQTPTAEAATSERTAKNSFPSF